MKVAPLCRALKSYPAVKHMLVHTGQHYDVRMSEQFFNELDIPSPDVNLEIGSGTHAEQVGRTMIAFEKVLHEEHPDWVVLFGDVNATCACSITAKKEHVMCAHVEAGLRSRDMDMPEEINRLVTDRLCDLLFTPDRISDANLRSEGVPEEKIKFVGNVMIDTLERERSKAAALDIGEIVAANLMQGAISAPSLSDGSYVALTMHRPSNVDGEDVFRPAVRFMLDEVASEVPLVWAVHPRTRRRLEEFRLWGEIASHPNLVLVNPLGYHAMLRLNMGARLMLTDSGGLQEECCVLGTPCLTLRWNTERPVTLMENGGASILVGNAVDKMRAAYHEQMAAPRRAMRPELWDGHAAERIAKVLAEA